MLRPKDSETCRVSVRCHGKVSVAVHIAQLAHLPAERRMVEQSELLVNGHFNFWPGVSVLKIGW